MGAGHLRRRRNVPQFAAKGESGPKADQLPKFQVTRGGGVMPTIMAQCVFGYVTLIARMPLEAKEFQNKRELARMELVSYRSASSVTVGILGLGDIGQGVGKMLRGAGYKVLGFKRHTIPAEAANLAFCADRITTDLDDVLVNTDYIVSVLPSTNATRYLLNEKNLQQCRERSPVFINIGRGDVISEKTLVDAEGLSVHLTPWPTLTTTFAANLWSSRSTGRKDTELLSLQEK